LPREMFAGITNIRSLDVDGWHFAARSPPSDSRWHRSSLGDSRPMRHTLLDFDALFGLNSDPGRRNAAYTNLENRTPFINYDGATMNRQIVNSNMISRSSMSLMRETGELLGRQRLEDIREARTGDRTVRVIVSPNRTVGEKIIQSVMFIFNASNVWTGKMLLFRLEYDYTVQLYSNWKNLKECPVCFGITTNYQKLDCNHYLCSTCFKQMTNRGDCHYLQKCPMCRAPISKPKPKPNTIHSEANIQLVMDIARVNRIEATRALTASNGDLIMAIMSFVD